MAKDLVHRAREPDGHEQVQTQERRRDIRERAWRSDSDRPELASDSAAFTVRLGLHPGSSGQSTSPEFIPSAPPTSSSLAGFFPPAYRQAQMSSEARHAPPSAGRIPFSFHPRFLLPLRPSLPGESPPFTSSPLLQPPPSQSPVSDALASAPTRH